MKRFQTNPFFRSPKSSPLRMTIFLTISNTSWELFPVTLRGWLDEDNAFGREFMNETFEWEVGYHHELELPEGVNKAIQRMKERER